MTLWWHGVQCLSQCQVEKLTTELATAAHGAHGSGGRWREGPPSLHINAAETVAAGNESRLNIGGTPQSSRWTLASRVSVTPQSSRLGDEDGILDQLPGTLELRVRGPLRIGKSSVLGVQHEVSIRFAVVVETSSHGAKCGSRMALTALLPGKIRHSHRAHVIRLIRSACPPVTCVVLAALRVFG